MKESILKCKDKSALRMAIIELSDIKRHIKSNKKSLNWMNPHLRPIYDNSLLVPYQKNHVQYLIDLCRERIKQI